MLTSFLLSVLLKLSDMYFSNQNFSFILCSVLHHANEKQRIACMPGVCNWYIHSNEANFCQAVQVPKLLVSMVYNEFLANCVGISFVRLSPLLKVVSSTFAPSLSEFLIDKCFSNFYKICIFWSF